MRQLSHKLHVAIVGAGPAGFYTAQQLLKVPKIHVTMFEKRLVPYGLVRYGVAPDHPEVKNVISKFEQIAKNPQFQYFGNAHLGQDFQVEQLEKAFNAVVIASGSHSERTLGIEGEEDMKNVFSAKQFVGWYNGDPDVDIDPDLESHDTAVIIGQGNVALDCARLLLSPIETLMSTDISERALTKLRDSKIKHVHVVGRRGALQASFTSKEVREMMALPNVSFNHDDSMINDIKSASTYLKSDRPKKRLMDLLLKGTNNTSTTASWNLKFLSSPISFHSENKVLKGINFTKNKLVGDSPPKMKCLPTDETYSIPCGLLIKSVGYLNTPVEGLPFDNKKCVIPNLKGRVVDIVIDIFVSNDGVYVSGWIKTGPTGVIASTMFDSQETARMIIEDLETAKPEKNGVSDLNCLNMDKWTSFEDWVRIDNVEKERASTVGSPRSKICSNEEMLNIIRHQKSQP
ncbi:hypothetical protein BC833DRAFT_615693 [Globomyces pollinis-pini]|nr:hypothetical protein BC833DRAFT_615693 [Globomyces pollinis-pini]